MIKNINLNKIISFAKKTPEALAKRPFALFLALSVIAFLIGGIVFYKYFYSIKKAEPKGAENQFKINEENHQKVLNYWKLRTKKFEEADSKEFKNPFQ